MIQAIDDAILQFIQQYCRTPFGDVVLPAITFLGNSGLIWIAAAILLFAFRKRKAGTAVVLALILSVVVGNWGIKILIERPRPCDVDPSVELLIPHPGEFSFPSGHTCASFSAAVAIFKALPRKFGIPAIVLATLISLSRLYVGVHYPTDIAAGLVIGILSGWTAWMLVQKYETKKSSRSDK